MTGDEERADPEVRQSVDSFRRAGTAVEDGIGTLYESSRVWLGRRHSLVRFAAATAVWFVGNWTYNRIAPPVVRIATVGADRLSFGFAVGPVVTFFEGKPVLVFAQFLTALVAVVVAQDRIQTRRLTGIENKLTIMATTPRKATDGGSRKLPPTGGRAIGGAIAGGALGLSFGPGGLLAGALLGFMIGDKRDIRAYERNPHTPDLNAESKPER